MDYRDDRERGRRYRDEPEYRGAERERDRRDWDRRDWERRGWDRGDWERRDWERRRRGDERGFVERIVDELRAWFSDEEARRRPFEEREAPERWGGRSRTWGGAPEEEVDRGWARQWGYVERGGREPRWARERGSGWGDPSAWGAERGMPSSFEPSRGGVPGGGPYAGLGPRGYQRPDERIREDVCDALCAHGSIDASDLEVTVDNGEVTLSGVVRKRAEKRLAEELAEQTAGVREVHNQLRVAPATGREPPARPGDARFRAA
jgi:hypothetical protein